MNKRIFTVKNGGRKTVHLDNGLVLTFQVGTPRQKILSRGCWVMMTIALAMVVLAATAVVAAPVPASPEPSAEPESAQVSELVIDPAPMGVDKINMGLFKLPPQQHDASGADPVPEVEAESELTPVDGRELVSLGDYRITAYCACEKCCGAWAKNRPLDENGNEIVKGAAGKQLISGLSVAAWLPFGTELYIPAIDPDTIFVVADRTAKYIRDYYDEKIVDIYIDSHQGCYDYIRGKPEWAEVFIVK